MPSPGPRAMRGGRERARSLGTGKRADCGSGSRGRQGETTRRCLKGMRGSTNMDSNAWSRLSMEGKIAVVTGGTQGLGETIAHTFADRGAAGIAICGRNLENGARVKVALEAKGVRAIYAPADLASVEEARSVTAEA